MPPWVEWGMVLALVFASALFALWRLVPAVWRLRWQVRFGWRVANGTCGCDACPAANAGSANSRTLGQ